MRGFEIYFPTEYFYVSYQSYCCIISCNKDTKDLPKILEIPKILKIPRIHPKIPKDTKIPKHTTIQRYIQRYPKISKIRTHE